MTFGLVLGVCAGMLLALWPGHAPPALQPASLFGTLSGLPPVRVPAAPVARLAQPLGPLPPGATGRMLAELDWRFAGTGWHVPGEGFDPVVGHSFSGGPMAVAGEAFQQGIATYPFSEIVYDLEKRGLRFRCRIGVTDDSEGRSGSVRFFVYGDEFLLYESDTIRAGETARNVELDLRGFSALRLIVDDAGDGSRGDYALWAEPLLFTMDRTMPVATNGSIRAARREQAAVERKVRTAEAEGVRARRALDKAALERNGSHGREGTAAFDEHSSQVVLSNDRVAVILGYGGERNGRLTLIRRLDELPVLQDVAPTITTVQGKRLELVEQRPEPSAELRFARMGDPRLGPGIEAVVRFRSPEGDGRIILNMSLFDRDSALRLTVNTEGLPLVSVQYLDPAAGGIFLGGDVRYLSDGSRRHRGALHPDGHVRRIPIEATGAGLVWSEATGQGLRVRVSDPASLPLWLTLRREPGRLGAMIGLELHPESTDSRPTANILPSVLLQLTEEERGPHTVVR